jgi:pyruvate,water dikinase
MDDPTPTLATLKMYLCGEGQNPHERQQAQAEGRRVAEAAILGRLKRMRRWAFRKTLGWAQTIVPLREDSIAEIGRGYPVLRQMLLELGRRYASAGMIANADDIFWLKADEVADAAAALERGGALPERLGAVKRRKAQWQARKQVTPPPQLPAKAKYFGINVEQMLPGGAGEAEDNELRGVGASPGQATAVARVLHGPEDFDQMQPGDVLVAAITTPAWTPLFAMASAIVTDVGGPLSHGSIVAREYGIPAVLGTGLATRRIRSGQRVTVNGSEGLVIINNGGR